MNRSYPYLILGFVAWFLGASPAPAVGDVRYTITELPMHRAWAINDSGVVAGEIGGIPVRWNDGQLDQAPGAGAVGPWDINNADVIVGGGPQAYRWEGDTRTPLPTLGGLGSSARGINETGQIVGWLGDGATNTRGCLWEDDNITFLGALGGEQSWALAINEGGIIVGYAETGPPTPTGAGPTQAFIYQNNAMTPIVGPYSIAYDINDAGQIVGQASPAQGFLWENGVWSYLPFPSPNAYFSVAEAINNSGQIVGRATVAGYDEAVLWDDDEVHYLIDLIPADSGWTKLERATAINDAGQIVGWGNRASGEAWHAFLLTPIPEPSSFAMLVVAAALARLRSRPRWLRPL